MSDSNTAGRREWIVPEEARDFVEWDGTADCPVVRIPDRWPEVGPTVPHIRNLVSEGFGLQIQGVFDLDLLGESASRLEVLYLPAGPDVRGADVLMRMTALRFLHNPLYEAASMPEVDLSRLPNLRHVNVHSPGLLSALGAPNVEYARAEVPSLTSATPLSPSIRSAVLIAPRMDFDHVARHLTNVKFLSLVDCRQIDLSPIHHLRALEELDLVSVRSIEHAEALRGLTALRRLTIDGTSKMTGLHKLLDLRVGSFFGYGAAFDANFAAAAKRRNWTVTPTKNASQSHFDLIVSDAGPVEIHFTDWEWLAATIGDDEQEPPSSFELEAALESAIVEQPDHPALTFTFDSEGDAFIAQTIDEGNALQLLAIWDRVLADPAELRRHLASKFS